MAGRLLDLKESARTTTHEYELRPRTGFEIEMSAEDENAELRRRLGEVMTERDEERLRAEAATAAMAELDKRLERTRHETDFHVLKAKDEVRSNSDELMKELCAEKERMKREFEAEMARKDREHAEKLAELQEKLSLRESEGGRETQKPARRLKFKGTLPRRVSRRLKFKRTHLRRASRRLKFKGTHLRPGSRWQLMFRALRLKLA